MIEEIKKRRSIRKYQSKEVDKKDILEIIKAAQFAPNGRHKKAWEFIIVQDKNVKKKIFETLDDDFILKAPVLIVPIMDAQKTDLFIQDLSLASGYIFLQAVSFGLGTVWKNIDPENAQIIKKILNIPENFLLINIIPLGYPDENIPEHNDNDFEPEKIHWEGW